MKQKQKILVRRIEKRGQLRRPFNLGPQKYTKKCTKKYAKEKNTLKHIPFCSTTQPFPKP